MIINSITTESTPAAKTGRNSAAGQTDGTSFAAQIRDTLQVSQEAASTEKTASDDEQSEEASDPYQDIKTEMCRKQASRKLELERSEKQAAAIESASTKRSETEEILERLRLERMRQNMALQRSEQRTALIEEASKNRQAVEAANRSGEKPVTEHAAVELHGVSAAELLACL